MYEQNKTSKLHFQDLQTQIGKIHLQDLDSVSEIRELSNEETAACIGGMATTDGSGSAIGGYAEVIGTHTYGGQLFA